MKPAELREALEAIAKEANVPTLEAKFSDRSDFHDIAVWQLEKMLKAAYLLGLDSAKDHVAKTNPTLAHEIYRLQMECLN